MAGISNYNTVLFSLLISLLKIFLQVKFMCFQQFAVFI